MNDTKAPEEHIEDAEIVEYDLAQPENRAGASVDDSPPKRATGTSSKRKKSRRRSSRQQEPAPASSTSAEAAPSPTPAEEVDASATANGAVNGAKPSAPPKPRRRVKLRGVLRDLLPNAEQLKVYKAHLGKQSHIQNYKARDLATVGDLEEFIKVNLVPEYGGGDYQIDVVDPHGKVTSTVPLSFAEPKKRDQSDAMVQQVEWLQKKIENMESGQKVDPFEMMVKAKKIFGDEGKDAMSMVMLQMMQQMQTNNPTVAELKSFLEHLKESSKPRPATPLPPLGADKEDSLKEVIQLIVKQSEDRQATEQRRLEREREIEERRERERREERAEADRRYREEQERRREEERRFWEERQKEADRRHESMMTMMSKQNETQMEMMRQQNQSQLEILRAQQEAERARLESKIERLNEDIRGTASPQETLQQAKEIVEWAEQISGGRRNQTADSLFGFLNNLINSSGNVSDAFQRAVDKIRVVENARAPAQLPAGTGAEDAPSTVDNGTPTQTSTSIGTNLPRDLPIGVKDTLMKAAGAEDQSEQVRLFLGTLKMLMDRGEGQWQRNVRHLLVTAVAGRREEALQGIENYLQHFVDLDALEPEGAEKIYATFDEHYDRIIQAIKEDNAPEAAPPQ